MSNGQELVLANQAVAVRRDSGMVSSIPEMMQVADIFAKSGLFNDVRDVAKAFVKIQAGRELGVPPFASMRGISIIQGAPALGSTLVAGRMKAAGYDWTEVRRDNEACELEITKPNGKRAGIARFTLDDAKAAGLAGKDNWKKYPRSMLFARCITDAARTFAPEVFSGIPVYTAEELGAAQTDEDGMTVDAPTETVDQVRDRKVNEAQAAGIDTAKYAKNATASKQFDLGKMIKAITALKDKVGREFYYATLGAEGYEHANEIRDREVGKRIYKVLESQAAIAAKPTYTATDDDVPGNIGTPTQESLIEAEGSRAYDE